MALTALISADLLGLNADQAAKVISAQASKLSELTDPASTAVFRHCRDAHCRQDQAMGPPRKP